MSQNYLHETFSQPQFDSRLHWLNPPQQWRIQAGRLTITPDAGTDFWQRTHYGFQADSGHLLHLSIPGDFIQTTELEFKPAHQYDQAGLMIRLSPECWLKCSLEHEPNGPNRLGAVVTNQGYSDWSTQDYGHKPIHLAFQIRREANDYLVFYAPITATSGQRGSWSQLRIARLLQDDGRQPVQCGLYACSPKAGGFTAHFSQLKVEPGPTES